MSFVPIARAFRDALEAAGLDPDALEPWEAWRCFKQFARTPVPAADATAAVVELDQTPGDDGLHHLRFVRYFGLLTADGAPDDEPEPVFAVECALGYEPEPGRAPVPAFELADADYASFDAFVAAVEGEPAIQSLWPHVPAGSQVRWYEL